MTVGGSGSGWGGGVSRDLWGGGISGERGGKEERKRRKEELTSDEGGCYDKNGQGQVVLHQKEMLMLTAAAGIIFTHVASSNLFSRIPTYL